MKPVIGILLGDSAGIGPEIVAKSAANGYLTSRCKPLVIGDLRVFDYALKLIGQKVDHYPVSDVSQADWEKGIPVLDRKDQDPAGIKTAEVQESCGRAVISMMEIACELCEKKVIQGFCYGPFNKTALKKAGFHHESEHGFFAELLGVKGPFGELNP